MDEDEPSCTDPVEALCVRTCSARFTRIADSSLPLDTHTVSQLYTSVLRSSTHLHDLANALVTTYLALLRREGKMSPFVGHDAEVGMADAGVCTEAL